jgi:hypothetical protein
LCPFLTPSVAAITEVLDLKGLKKGMNKAGHTKGLTQEGNDKTHIKRARRLIYLHLKI